MSENHGKLDTPTLSHEELMELRESIKAEIRKELQDEKNAARLKIEQEREERKKKRDEYVAKMKESDEPWVDIVGDSIDENGIKIGLEWNDAFVKYLRESGLTGSDEEAIVQRWLAMVSRDVSEQMIDDADPKPPSEYA